MDEAPKYFATKKYKLWVRQQLAERGWTYKRFASEVTRRGHKCSEQALQQCLGKKAAEPVPSNTALMPGINRALGLPVPAHFDPTNPLSVMHAAIDSGWPKIAESAQRAIASLLNVTEPDAE